MFKRFVIFSIISTTPTLLMADDRPVSSIVDLYNTLITISPNDNIILSPGNYGELIINGTNVLCTTTPSSQVTTSTRSIKICGFPKQTNVTLRPRDSKGSMPQPSSVTFDTVSLYGVDNISFDSLNFSLKSSNSATASLSIIDDTNKPNNGHSSRISITNSNIEAIDKPIDSLSSPNDFGVFIRNANNITLSGNLIYRARTGIAITSDNPSNIANYSNHITISRNDIVKIQRDGIDVNGVDDLLIDENLIHEQRPLGDIDSTGNTNGFISQHADMIQFQTGSSGQPVVNGMQVQYGSPLTAQQRTDELAVLSANLSDNRVVIKNNVMVRGTTDCHAAPVPPSVYAYNPCNGGQGIFARSFTAEAKAGYPTDPDYAALKNSFVDFKVMNNVVFTTDASGISFDGANEASPGTGNGLEISHNTVLVQYNPSPAGIDILRGAAIPSSPYTIVDPEKVECSLSTRALIVNNIADKLTANTIPSSCTTVTNPFAAGVNYSAPSRATFFINYASAANPSGSTTVGQLVGYLAPSASSGVPRDGANNPTAGFVLKDGASSIWYNTTIRSGL